MDITHFHFIRPYWLCAIIALVIIISFLKKYRVQQSGWQSFIPEHLAKVLISTKDNSKPLSLVFPLIIGLLAIIAMAGPTWKKLPQPVYQVARGSVVIMDMSYSMYATDLSPNRATRARYKTIDLLKELTEGEVGLIAYAGDAFTISPLTEDIKNIHLLLPALSPDIMPVLGSNPLAALTLAQTMLLNAGHITGDIYWITDGIDNGDIKDINAWSNKNEYTLNILGVGTTNGAPIKLTNGELMKDSTGSIIIPKLHTGPLKQVAAKASGNYVTLSQDNHDINTLLASSLASTQKNKDSEERESQNVGDQWQDVGPYLLFLILPFIMIYFRRGVLVCVLALLLNLAPNQSAYANTVASNNTTLNKADSNIDESSATNSNAWNNLWKTNDQQAQDKFNAQSYQDAAVQFSDPLWQGSAYYKAGEYENALASFQQIDSAQSLYNQGNTLAKLQKLEEAIKAYDKALAINPDLADAKVNKEIIEQLKKQQEENQEQSGDSDDKSENDESSENNDNNENSDSEKQSDERQNQNEKNDNSEGDSSESENADNNASQNESSESKDSESKDAQQDQSSQEKNNPSDDSDEKSAEEKAVEQDKQSKEGKNQDEAKALESQEAQASSELSKEEAEKAKEMAQKYQQLLNKVTDDPYMLLRNKMQLEYQKRRQNQSPSGVQKQW